MSYISKEDLLKANDLTEEDVELPSLGVTVRVKALPAAYSNQAASEAVVQKQVGRDTISTVDKGKMEVIQVMHGLVEPKLANMKEAEIFATNCGPAFAKVIEAIDRISGVDKEEIENTEARFPSDGSGKARVNVATSDTGRKGSS